MKTTEKQIISQWDAFLDYIEDIYFPGYLDTIPSAQVKFLFEEYYYAELPW